MIMAMMMIIIINNNNNAIIVAQSESQWANHPCCLGKVL